MSACCQQQTFIGLLDMINGVPGKALKFAGHRHETSAPHISEFGGRRCRAASDYVYRASRNVSIAAGALDCLVSGRRR
jgi:hypothetical protein